MQTPRDTTMYWTGTLVFGVFFLAANIFGVWQSRCSALEVNGIELSAWWYLFALPPVLSVLAAIKYPHSHPAWQRSYLFVTLNTLVLASLVHMPVLYVLGGFD